jgi:hypothetical protein
MESRHAAILGILTALILGCWQLLTVHYNYGGNWTALFRIGPQMPVPAFLSAEHLYVFQGELGYDGQVYHLIAHDPWMRKGSAEAINSPGYRYQRILVPALAWCVALGRDAWIHAAYVAVMLGFSALGVYWLALFAVRAGFAATWGLAFALTPAAIVSIDRMTIDVALAAFVAGFALYAEAGAQWKTVAVLGCAALTRETAWPMIALYAIFLLTRRRFADALWVAVSAAPTAAWYIFLSQRLGPTSAPSYLTWIPFAGLAERIFHPVVYSLPALKSAIATGCDYLALAGVVVTLVLAARMALQRRWDGFAAAIYGLAAAAVFIQSRSVWEDANAFGRVLTPLLLLTAMFHAGRRPWLAFMPMFLVDTRLSLDLWSQVAGVARGIFR